MRRQEWLVAVRDGQEEKLKELLQQDQNDAASAADSRDAAAVGRAGPCAGYESLKTLASFQSHAVKFRQCTSTATLKATNEECAPTKKLLNVLIASCRTAVTELRSAKQRALNAEAAAQKKREKEEKEAGKKKGKGQVGRPVKAGVVENPIFKLECERQAVPSSNKWEPDSDWLLDRQVPFILSSIKCLTAEGDVAEKKLAECMREFCVAFDESSLKVGAVFFAE